MSNKPYRPQQPDRQSDDPTKGMTREELEKKYGTVAANDTNYLDGIRNRLNETHTYEGGFWWPRG